MSRVSLFLYLLMYSPVPSAKHTFLTSFSVSFLSIKFSINRPSHTYTTYSYIYFYFYVCARSFIFFFFRLILLQYVRYIGCYGYFQLLHLFLAVDFVVVIRLSACVVANRIIIMYVEEKKGEKKSN